MISGRICVISETKEYNRIRLLIIDDSLHGALKEYMIDVKMAGRMPYVSDRVRWDKKKAYWTRFGQRLPGTGGIDYDIELDILGAM